MSRLDILGCQTLNSMSFDFNLRFSMIVADVLNSLFNIQSYSTRYNSSTTVGSSNIRQHKTINLTTIKPHISDEGVS